MNVLRPLVGFACVAAWALAAQTARSQLDPELDKPYRLQIVLRVAENRFLTPLFQEQLERDVGDQLQLALGALAKVEVVREHLLLRAIEAKGLEGGLDGWEQLSPIKTHFVLLDFDAGIYRLEARQHDGMTGLAAPTVRRAQTSDRALVAALAARLVEQDFAIAGTVIEAGKEVRLALKGGKLSDRLDRWVKPGEVFALSRILPQGDGKRGSRIPWALLEVVDAPKEGVCRCRLWRRFQEDDLRPAPGVLGYRAVKLSTTTAPLKLRVIDDTDYRPLVGVQVHIRAAGGDKKVELSTNRDGLAGSAERFPHLAVVQLISSNGAMAEFPVEVLGEGTVVCRLKNVIGAEGQAGLEARRDLWVRRLYDNLRLASERSLDLKKELSQSLTAALDLARTGLRSMDEEIERLTSEHVEIQRQAAERKVPAARLELAEGEQRLGELRQRYKDLERAIARIDEAIKESKSEKTLALFKTLEQAKLLEAEADFDEAIALYEKVLAASPDQAKVREHLQSLKSAWTPKNDKHAEARRFLYRVWPKLEAGELKKNIDEAKAALTVCKEAGDALTARKVVRANIIHAGNLKKRLDSLGRQNTEDSRAEAKAIAQAADGLRRFHAEAVAMAGKKGD